MLPRDRFNEKDTYRYNLVTKLAPANDAVTFDGVVVFVSLLDVEDRLLLLVTPARWRCSIDQDLLTAERIC